MENNYIIHQNLSWSDWLINQHIVAALYWKLIDKEMWFQGSWAFEILKETVAEMRTTLDGEFKKGLSGVVTHFA